MSVAKLLQQWGDVWNGEEGAGSGPCGHTLDADMLQRLAEAAEKDAAALREAARTTQKTEEELQRGTKKPTSEVVELRLKLATVLEAELKRREQWLAAASGMDGFYDAVLMVDKLEDVYDLEKGWQVKTRDFDLALPREGVRVIPIGQFNTGKTWIIGKLCGEELPSGMQVHTEGISIKVAAADGLKIVLLDTVGSNSPMYALPDGVAPSAASAGAEAVLEELRAQEDFYRQLCYLVGQVILVVVGQMSHKDQTDLLRLARTMRKDRVRKDIVVVHNLREWTMKMLLHKSAKDGLDYRQRTKTLFGLSEGHVDVTIGTETHAVVRHHGMFQGEGDSRDFVVNVFHYYLTNDGLPCSRNKFAIKDMKATITRNDVGGNRALAQEFAVAAEKLQGRFASFSGSEPKIIFDASKSCFRVEAPLPVGAFKMKPRDLGGYFALGSDDPSYSTTLLPCTAVTWKGRGTARTEVRQDRSAYHLQIELPGLCPESWTLIQGQFRDHSALSKEPLEGEKGKQWTVSFQAKLLNVPQALHKQVQQSTEGEVEVQSDPSAHEITDVGSRPNFRDGARTVKVTLRTGIMDYDSSQAPVVTYLDGVLGITLMKEAR